MMTLVAAIHRYITATKVRIVHNSTALVLKDTAAVLA
jgi:hypothetical protein